MIKIYAPASIGNVSVGFDILGAAIYPVDGTLLGDCISINYSTVFHIDNTGFFVKKLPKNMRENIVYQCWERFCKEMRCKKIPVLIKLEKNMPICSGLGSSACSVVAAIMAMNEFFGNKLEKRKIIRLMGELEGRLSGGIHYDNVAPCYFGGLQLMVQEENFISQNVPEFDNWLWVVAYPGIQISTEKARSILPEKYGKEECMNHARYLAGFIHACHTKQPFLAAKLMKDVIAEPYRTPLVPNFIKTSKQSKKIGALACGISGSGPTIFVVCNSKRTGKYISEWIKDNYIKTEEGFVHICRLDTVGARKLEKV